MLVIGIVGGVASGKSSVADYFRDLGACVINVDGVGHEVLRDGQVEQAVRQRWGDVVFDDDGHVDRVELARIVFAPTLDGPKQLTFLEQLTHPRIAQQLRHRIHVARASGTTKAVVLDAAVLLKAGWDRFCDRIVFVDAPREMRRERAGRRVWTAEQFAAREMTQPPLDVQRGRADFVVDNSTSPEHTRAMIHRFWNSLSE